MKRRNKREKTWLLLGMVEETVYCRKKEKLIVRGRGIWENPE